MKKLFHLSCGAVVAARDKDIQVVLIKARRQAGVLWGLPKGHVEPGESLSEAALRETCEETGLAKSQLRLLGYLGRIRYEFISHEAGKILNEKHVHFFLYLARKKLHTLAPAMEDEGILDVVWMPVANAVKRVSYDSYRQMLLLANLALHGRELRKEDTANPLDTAEHPYKMGA
ncbi:NUDIX domain-containing protein [bacterium]|nr:NUDIX domain-containing protein [bacterium]